ncbi:MAG: hypothetical protein AB1489_33335, partial [Acidobacteriota bacterium]
HNIWVFDLPVITTICGWGMTLKSVSYICIANQAEKMIPVGENAHRKYVYGGIIMLPITLLLIYQAFFRLH